MGSAHETEVKFEIGHVMFIDFLVTRNCLSMMQSDQIQKLREIVRGTEQVRPGEAAAFL